MVMRKRGLSHLEVIFSVIIFMGAVGTALFFFDPATSYRLGEPSYKYIVKAIEDNLTTNVTIFGVETDSDKVNNITVNMKLKEGNDKKLGVKIKKNLDDNTLISYKVDNFDQGKISWNSNDKFVYVLVSDDFELSGINSLTGSNGKTTITSVYTKKVISEKRANGLKANYGTNYFALRKFFGIGENVNFGFEIGFSNTRQDIKTTSRTPSDKVNIISNTKRVEILNKDGKFEFASFNVRVW